MGEIPVGSQDIAGESGRPSSKKAQDLYPEAAIVTSLPRRRAIAGLLALSMSALTMGTFSVAHAQTTTCDDQPAPEIYGPTDITATSGNRRLSVAVNHEGTVTVLKWPSPSYYDQIKYTTEDRTAPRMGAAINEGAFLGLAYRNAVRRGRPAPPWRFSWLREWSNTQRFASADGDEVVTTFRRGVIGLKVVQRDVVVHDKDALVRSVTVSRTRRSRIRGLKVFSFANFNPVVERSQQGPYEDWCTEENNDEGAFYRKTPDAIVAARSGFDPVSNTPSSVAMAMAFDGRADGFHVGSDSYEVGVGLSAYDDASNAKLSRNTGQVGQADSVMLDNLSLSRSRSASTSAIITGGTTETAALNTLKAIRARRISDVRSSKARWWRAWLRTARLPQNAPDSVVRLAKRSLIVTRQAADPRGFIVTSIATQAPYGSDNIRHGAYINRALEQARHPEMVRAHNLEYAENQSTATKPEGNAPIGNWATSYYADGQPVGGSPVQYQIDQTGLGIWTLWDHYLQGNSRDVSYRNDVYGAIQLAANYLSDTCFAPLGNGAYACAQPEEGGTTATLKSAQAVWLGLDAASKAASAVFGSASSNAVAWASRRDRVATAIESQFYGTGCAECYTASYQTGGTLLWPVGYLESPRGGKDAGDTEDAENAQARQNWLGIRDAVLGDPDVVEGHYETRALLGNAYALDDAGDSPEDRARVRRGLRWVAEVPTTNSTGLLGEHWMVRNGRVITTVSQPHVWSHAMFYLGSLKAFGSRSYYFD